MNGTKSLIEAPDLRALAEAARDAMPWFPWSTARHCSFGTVERGGLELSQDPAGDFADAASPVVVLALLDAVATLEKRLRHSEWHRTANRRRMRRLGKYQGVLEAKIVRQRNALREFARPKKGLVAHTRAADLHRSLRNAP